MKRKMRPVRKISKKEAVRASTLLRKIFKAIVLGKKKASGLITLLEEVFNPTPFEDLPEEKQKIHQFFFFAKHPELIKENSKTNPFKLFYAIYTSNHNAKAGHVEDVYEHFKSCHHCKSKYLSESFYAK